MAAALSDFQLASELGPSPSEADQLRELCSRQAEQIERLQDLATEPQQAEKQPHGTVMQPAEKQALLEILSDLAERVKALELLTAKQARQIEAMGKTIEELVSNQRQQTERIDLVRDGILRVQNQLEDLESRISRDIALDRQRITKLETPEFQQPKQKDRADMLRLLLVANNGKMLAKDARHRLGVSESQFSQLLGTMSATVETRPLHTDRRRNVILLKPSN